MSLYFALPPLLALFFYFSFQRYKRWMLPAVIFHIAIAAAALCLQLFGIVDLPGIITVNNIAVFGIVYTTVLAVMEAVNKNRIMMLTVPFLIIAYIFALYYYYIFYTRQDAASHYYHDYYFLLILAILIYSIWHFFRDVYRQKRENELLSLQRRLAHDSYENIQTHLRETARLKHDMRGHFAAMQAYLEHGRIEDARDYLTRYAGQSAAVTETVYSEHFLMNAVLGSLYERAGQYGIRVELNLHAAPANIADPDLYSLLSNITDNAIEACIAMPEDSERFVRLTVTRREPYLNIHCVNSKAGEIVSRDGKIQTTKTGDGHGYGLWSIGRIVDAYAGLLHIEHDENTFTITVALKD
jgi:hypothetical protein